MIVVADTSPINYLVLIDEIEILPSLFGRVVLPATVVRELTADAAPSVVRRWAAVLPGWIEIKGPPAAILPATASLGAGERDAISIAVESGIHSILMDEYAGRLVARAVNLNVTGTLGVLEAASKRAFVDFEDAIRRLLLTNFRVSPKVITAFHKAT